MPDRCLDIAELQLAAAGRLAPDRAQHLAVCPLCASAAEGLELNDLAAWPANEIANLAAEQRPARTTATSRWGRISRLVRYAAAAAIIGVLVWAGYRYEPAGADPAGVLAEFAHVEEPYSRVTRGAAEAPDDYYAAASGAYAAGKYAESARLYAGLVDRASTELLATRGRYEYGLALWRTGRHDEAIDELTAARFGESSYYQDATWALAQLYRAAGDDVRARQLFVDLTKDRLGPYAERARRAILLLDGAEEDAERGR